MQAIREIRRRRVAFDRGEQLAARLVMRSFADRTVKVMLDVTLGAVIVVVHAALAEHDRERAYRRSIPPRVTAEPRHAFTE